MREIATLGGRSKDLVVLDLAQPASSSNYNPLKLGTPSELKDKIAGSIIWSEEFYKKVCERVLLEAFIGFERSNFRPCLNSIHALLSGNSQEKKQMGNLKVLSATIKEPREYTEGLRTDIALWVLSEIQEIISDPAADSCLDWILGNKIVYINLNTLAFEETARRFGRLILQDLKTAVQRLQGLPKDKRPFTGVYIDEFASVASSGFIELLNKARSAQVSLTLAHQSLGDLQSISPSFASQILDNTNIKFIFRLDSPDTSDFFSRLVGTRKSEKRTMQTNLGLISGTTQTGVGTSREVDEFIVSPNQLRQLKRGEAVMISKIPYAIAKVKLISITDRVVSLKNKELKRRVLWPSFKRGVSRLGSASS